MGRATSSFSTIKVARLVLTVTKEDKVDLVVQEMMASPYEPIRNDRDVEETAALATAKKRVGAGQPQQQ